MVRKSTYSKSQIAKIATKAVMKKAETKAFGVEVTEVSLSSAVTCIVDEVSQLEQGDASHQKIGNKINPIGFHWNYQLNNNAAVPVYVRMIAYLADEDQFTATTDAFILAADALQPAALAAENLRDISRSLNKLQFRVVYDKTHRLAGLGDGTGIEFLNRKVFKKLKGHRQFNSNTTEDSKNNNLRVIMLVRSSDNDATASVVEVSYNTTYYFKDL